MDTELPDFLGGEPAPEPQAAEPVAAAPAAPEAPQEAVPAAAEASAGQPRGPDGKFAPVEAAPAAPAAEPQAEPPHAPITALLDERDKRQAAERRAEAAEVRARQLEDWRTQQEAALNRRPPPDRATDPEAWEAHRSDQIGQALYGQRLEMSRNFAELKHGEDVTKTAFDWGVQKCDADPFFNERVRAAKDPVGLVVAEWKREQAIAKVADPAELDAFLAWKAAGGNAPPNSGALAAPPQAPAAPRASLAAAPSAGSHAQPDALDGEATFGRMFGT